MRFLYEGRLTNKIPLVTKIKLNFIIMLNSAHLFQWSSFNFST